MMTVNLRQFEVGGVYHIFNRGYDKRKIFLDKNDYQRFVESLYYLNNRSMIKLRDVRKSKHTGSTCVFEPPSNYEPIIEILAFTLMPNHYHLVVREISPGGIALFMQKLGNGYTGYFNEKYNRKGAGGLFQGRYKSVKILNDIQLVTIFSYVHTNPVELVEPRWKDLVVQDKNKAIDFLKEYKWSSYQDYISKDNFPNVIQPSFYLDILGGSIGCQKSVEEWINFKAENNILRADAQHTG